MCRQAPFMPPGKSCAFGAIHPGPWWWLLRCFGPPSASDTPRRMSGWWSQCPWGRRRPLRRNHNGIGFLCRGASGRARCADGIEMAPLAAAGRIPGGNQDIGYRKKQTATVFSVGRDHWARRIQGGDVMNGAVGCVWLLFAIQPPWAVIVTWATGRRAPVTAREERAAAGTSALGVVVGPYAVIIAASVFSVGALHEAPAARNDFAATYGRWAVVAPSSASLRSAPSPQGEGHIYRSGCFLMLAKGRGNCWGVGFTLSTTTRRWVTSVPGMG